MGEFYFDPTRPPAASVIMLNGSDGGTPSARDARDLASAGFPTLALAYFKDWNSKPEGVPQSLNEIPLEYFFRAIEWLKTNPAVDPRRIVLVGQSRGAELALLLASLRPDVAGVAAFSPSNVVWQGVPPFGSAPTTPRPAWTLDGRAIPFQVESADRSLPLRNRFEVAVVKPEARIHVERIRGPVLLAASSVDKVWPADVYAADIAERLATRSSTSSVFDLRFEDASHLLMGTGPGVTRIEIPGTSFTFDFGGTAEGTARARARAWSTLKILLAGL